MIRVRVRVRVRVGVRVRVRVGVGVRVKGWLAWGQVALGVDLQPRGAREVLGAVDRREDVKGYGVERLARAGVLEQRREGVEATREVDEGVARAQVRLQRACG